MSYPRLAHSRSRSVEEVAVTAIDLDPSGVIYQYAGQLPRPVVTVTLPYDGQCQVALNEAEHAALQAVLAAVGQRVVREMHHYLSDLLPDSPR